MTRYKASMDEQFWSGDRPWPLVARSGSEVVPAIVLDIILDTIYQAQDMDQVTLASI